MITRRAFLQTGSLLFLNSCVSSLRSRLPELSGLSHFSPVDRAPRFEKNQMTGDDFTVPHRALWTKGAVLAEKKIMSSERTPLVVVGGGMSGLLSAYYLRDYRPIILEQASRFGGNAKAEVWNNIPYSLGAAYFTKADPGTPHDRLYHELGLSKEWVIKEGEDPIAYRGKILPSFWEQSSHPGDRALHRYFLDVLNERGFYYPEIPPVDPARREELCALDRVTFYDHLLSRSHSLLSPAAMTAIEQYCWSSFGGSARELSAASGLNFYAGEFGPLIVMPGGNARVAERLLEEIASSVPEQHLRPGSLVIDIKVGDEGAIVRYLDEREDLHEIVAQAVICACPKFVVPKLFDGIEPHRSAAIERLSYRAYLVANVLLKSSPPFRFYDTYLLGDGHVPGLSVQEQSIRAGVTDVILANYAHHDGDRAVLTLYQALPFEGGRGWLFGQTAQQLVEHFRTKTADQVLPTLGIPGSAVVDIRVTRWGHPLPLAAVNLISDGTLATAREPFQERVFFIEQDNWALPALETCVAEAASTTPQVRRFLG